MKNDSTKYLIAVFFFAISVALLRAQSNEGNTHIVTTVTLPPPASTNTLSTSNSVPSASAAVHAPGGGQRYEHINLRNSDYPAVPMGFGKTLIALAGIMFPAVVIFALPVTIVGIAFYSQHRRNKMLHETIRSMVEKGMPVSPELLAGLGGKHFDVDPSCRQSPGNPFDQGFPARERARNRHLLPGLVLTGIGLALIGVHPSHSGTGGWIIFFIGLAFLIVWLVDRADNRKYDSNVTERKQNNDLQPPKQ